MGRNTWLTVIWCELNWSYKFITFPQILCMKDGSVSEQGSFDQLMKFDRSDWFTISFYWTRNSGSFSRFIGEYGQSYVSSADEDPETQLEKLQVSYYYQIIVAHRFKTERTESRMKLANLNSSSSLASLETNASILMTKESSASVYWAAIMWIRWFNWRGASVGRFTRLIFAHAAPGLWCSLRQQTSLVIFFRVSAAWHCDACIILTQWWAIYGLHTGALLRVTTNQARVSVWYRQWFPSFTLLRYLHHGVQCSRGVQLTDRLGLLSVDVSSGKDRIKVQNCLV
jgi:hypothetical protein